MQKKDLPLFISIVSLVAFLTVFTAPNINNLALSTNVSTASQTAAVARAPRVQSVTMSPGEKVLLTEHVKRGGKSTVLTTMQGKIEAYYSEDLKKEDGNHLKFALVPRGEVYEISNIAGELPASIDGATVELTGVVSVSRGKKELLVNISSEKIKSIKGDREVIGKKGGTIISRESQAINCNISFCALVIPVDMTGSTVGLPTPTEIHDYIFTGRTKDALLEESYGQVSYAGDVTDWVSVPEQNISVFFAPQEIADYIANNNINIASYEQLVFLINGGPQASSGEASIGNASYWVNGSSYNIPVARVGFLTYQYNDNLTSANGNLSYFDYLYVHETGHNFNSLHDNLLNCKSGPVSVPSECMSVEQGNKYSIMGDGSYGGHFSVWQKLRAGWMAMPQLTSGGTHSLNPLESMSVTNLGIDGNTNTVPEFLMERRTSTGLDSMNLFTNLNLNGVFLYRVKNTFEQGVTSDPMTWDVGLIDTTPHLRSALWYESMNDVVFKSPQRYADRQTLKQFAQSLGGDNNTMIVSPAMATVNPCTRGPIKVFEPYINQGDTFTGQIQAQKWPVKMGTPSIATDLVQTIQADVNNPDAQIFLYKNVMLFNDDYVACGPGQYTFEFIVNGVSVPLFSEATTTYNPWSGPHFTTVMASLPVYQLPYGQHTVTLKITKLNDGTIFSRNLLFNLVP